MVHGDLSTKKVSDTGRNYSDTLLGAEYERVLANHVHVVDSKGFGCTIRAVNFSPGRLVCRRPAASQAVSASQSAR